MGRERKRKVVLRRPRRQAASTLSPKPVDDQPTIVAIGASAGGLEAIEQFLGAVPDSSGLAFVVIQHLDPTHPGIMPELLQRTTPMRVAQIKDRTRVEPNRVYVIPPNSDLSILRGVLHLVEPSSPRGLRLPIDFFLRALADDQRAASVAVILSGMGTDGTLGIKAVKERGGFVLVQDPATAKYDSMPRNAIDTRLVDVVAPVAELPARLVALRRGGIRTTGIERIPEPRSRNTLDQIVLLLRSRCGHDFSQYKKNTLERRVARRMALHQLTRFDDYLRYLRENPQEQQLLSSEFLIGVTNFFRDPAAWDALRDGALAALIAERPAGSQLRAWIPGCSTGEEAYSLAMIFKEVPNKGPNEGSSSLQIFATDLDQHAIEKARQGVYPANIASDVSPERLRRFFVKETDRAYRVTKNLREMVIAAKQDATSDPPFTRMDIVVCRNLLIYLEPEIQRRLIQLFHYSLRPGGILFLGTSETIGGLKSLFDPVNSKLRIYRRKESPTQLESMSLRPFFSLSPAALPEREAVRPVANLQTLADELVLRRFGPAAILVNEKGDILYVNGRTGKYLELAAGKANWNVFAMARDELRHALAGALQKASRQKLAVTVRGLTVGTNGEAQGVDLAIEPVQEPEALRGNYLVVFQEVTMAPAADRSRYGRRAARPGGFAEREREMRQLQDELRSTREDMQTSQEELRSANEELQSTNEELQSTNEELTTSREEMQSTNEELQTVNAELQAKVDEYTRASNDMKNLLNSIEIAVIFLDSSLRIRRYTEQATRLLRLIPTDVGRPITDVTSDLLFPSLPEAVVQVLRTLVPIEKEVQTTDGRWFGTHVMPYRTLDDVVEGVVITFVEVTTAKRLEAELRASRQRFGVLLKSLPDGVVLLDGQGRTVSRAAVLSNIDDARLEDLAAWKIVAAPASEPERGGSP